MDVHLRGAFLMTRRSPDLHDAREVGSHRQHFLDLGIGQPRMQANYAAAKAGLIGFTKTLALELGRFGVTANAIAPGFVETDMTQASAARQGLDYDEWKLAAAREILMGRIGKPEDIAAVASFLCREEADYVSGSGDLCVNGGAKS